MMHHPNMHHQPMSGHPPQHLPGHRAISAHHTMPPPLHGENRHVTLTRVPLGPGTAGGALGHPHGQPLGALGMVPPRPPHAIRAMHHPPAQHHSVPTPQMKAMRRGYMGGAYGGGALVHTYAPSPHHAAHAPHAGLRSPLSPTLMSKKLNNDFVAVGVEPAAEAREAEAAGEAAAAPEPEPAPLHAANSKEKTPMCLVNELARYNKIKHQYRLTSETGPAHKKVFTVTLRLGDTEEYTAEGSSIKRAQHAAASAALSATSFAAPPPRLAAAHSPPHSHHRHSVMPTVELNALAMKLCQPAVYSTVGAVALGARGWRARWAGGARLAAPHAPPAPPAPPALVYRVRVAVGGRAWLGEGGTPQAARHDAAARALQELRLAHQRVAAAPRHVDDDELAEEENGDPLNSEVKSPVSLVHELALKRNLTVQFSVKSERGPPHMRVFVTVCTVGDIETEGEGNGKKVSKRRAAERMLDEMRRRWPPALLRPRPHQDKRRHQPTKKKPRNLIKESSESGGAGGAGAGGAGAGGGGGDNPISRLAVACHAMRARSPQYRVLEERGAARRREFLVQCLAPPHAATGLGPNKKTAKRRAAHNVLLAMELSANGGGDATPTATSGTTATNGTDTATTPTPDTKPSATDTKRKESESQSSNSGNSEVRQPVPGVLLMDYHQRTGQPQTPNGVSETSATGGSGGSTPGAKDQLMYLSQLLGFTVQFSDFPKRNHGEYLSLVSLSTEPPVMCHGGGASTAHSHEQCARAALRALALMGLDTMQGAAAKPPVVTNGITE